MTFTNPIYSRNPHAQVRRGGAGKDGGKTYRKPGDRPARSSLTSRLDGFSKCYSFGEQPSRLGDDVHGNDFKVQVGAELRRCVGKRVRIEGLYDGEATGSVQSPQELMKRQIRWWRPLRKDFEHTGCRRIVFLSRRAAPILPGHNEQHCWLLSPGKLVDPRFLAVVVVPGKILAPRRNNRHPLATDASQGIIFYVTTASTSLSSGAQSPGSAPLAAVTAMPDPGELGALSMMTDARLGTGAAAQTSR